MAERKCGCEVGWRLPEGELIYYRWEIVALETNIARIYADDTRSERTSS